MDFTRQPIVETVIIPKDGCRLAIRSSKNLGQEEFIVETLEVVSFGTHCFFRSGDRPKAFLLPVSDYEVIEIREGRAPIKMASLEAVVKIPAIKEFPKPVAKELEKKEPMALPKASQMVPEPVVQEASEVGAPVADPRLDRRKDRKRGQKKRRLEREDAPEEQKTSQRGEGSPHLLSKRGQYATEEPPPVQGEPSASVAPVVTSTVLPPPSTLIREDMERLRKNEVYKGAFYSKDDEKEAGLPEAFAEPSQKHLQEDVVVPSKRPEETYQQPLEENLYKATPAPLDDGRSSPW